MIRILLVDDHKVMRDGLRLLLDDHADMQVVGEADHGRDALALAARLQIDVVVMDVAMPELNGIEATRRLLVRFPQMKVVALSMYNERKILTEMIQAGASALVVKGSATEDLVQAIRAAHAGRTFLAPEIARSVGNDFTERVAGERGKSGDLTNRELEVLQLVAEGGTTKSIGNRLDISAKTVDTHRQNIMRKLNLRTVAELTKYAVREGITSL
jgi:two-component system, NarL family, response regulator NreC